MVLNDKQIVALCEAGMIAPYEARQVREICRDPYREMQNRTHRRAISYGASSYGYDLRLAPEGLRVFSAHHATEIDPKRFDAASLIETPLRQDDDGAAYFLLPPQTYALGVTVETFQMPRNVLGMCVGKSTYARCGLIVNTTPLEPGWRGRLVLEMKNSTSLPMRVYANEGIAQCVFFQGEEPATSYADRGGKYQGQEGLTLARV